MVALRRVAWKLVEREAFEDIQRDQGGDALSVRWDLPHIVAAVARADRRNPRAGMAREICGAEQPAGFGREAHDRLGDHAVVEVLRFRLGDLPERRGVAWAAPDIADGRCLPIRRERFGPALKLRVGARAGRLRRAAPAVAQYRRDRVALLGVANRRLEQCREGQLPEALV